MDKYDPRRRIVLRGTLASGITLMLGACDSKQESSAAPRTSPAVATPPETSSAAPSAAEGLTETAPVAKLSKAIARYQTEPSGEQRCAGCAHFVAPNACRVVEGDISPDGWCTLWLAAPG